MKLHFKILCIFTFTISVVINLFAKTVCKPQINTFIVLSWTFVYMHRLERNQSCLTYTFPGESKHNALVSCVKCHTVNKSFYNVFSATVFTFSGFSFIILVCKNPIQGWRTTWYYCVTEICVVTLEQKTWGRALIRHEVLLCAKFRVNEIALYFRISALIQKQTAKVINSSANKTIVNRSSQKYNSVFSFEGVIWHFI